MLTSSLALVSAVANMTLPELLSRPAEPVVNTTNSTVPSPAVVPVNITRPYVYAALKQL